MRDLVINAPSRLDGLTQQMVDLTARIAPGEQRMTELHNEFDASAPTSVASNVTTAKDLLAFADQNVTRARDLTARPVSGEQSGLVDAVHSAESSLGQARALLDAVDSAASDIRHAVATLPSLIDDVQAGIEQATRLQKRKTAKPHISANWPRPKHRDQSVRRRTRQRFNRSARRVHTLLTEADAGLRRCWSRSLRSRRPPSASTVRWSTPCSPRSRGCTRCPNIDTRRGGVGQRRAPGSPKRAGDCKQQRTNGRPTSMKRSLTPTALQHWPLRPSRWPVPDASNPPSAPTPDATAATAWAR